MPEMISLEEGLSFQDWLREVRTAPPQRAWLVRDETIIESKSIVVALFMVFTFRVGEWSIESPGLGGRGEVKTARDSIERSEC